MILFDAVLVSNNQQPTTNNQQSNGVIGNRYVNLVSLNQDKLKSTTLASL